MAHRAFVDTNVLIYAIGDEPTRRGIAQGLIPGAVLSAQVFSEAANVLRRKFALDPAAIRTILEEVLLRVECRPLDEATVFDALALASRTGYSHYDSQIVASALRAGCNVLYSEDMQHGRTIDGLIILNPFMTEASA
jgi:predicted nucleic acid-binding protein